MLILLCLFFCGGCFGERYSKRDSFATNDLAIKRVNDERRGKPSFGEYRLSLGFYLGVDSNGDVSAFLAHCICLFSMVSLMITFKFRMLLLVSRLDSVLSGLTHPH